MALDITGQLGAPPRAAVGVAPSARGKPAGPELRPEAEGADKLAPPPLKGQETAPPPGEDAQAQAENVRQAVENLKELVQQVRRNLEFSVDKESGREVIKVIDAETDEVIRQIPSEEVLRISRHFKESLGALIRLEA